MLNYETKLEIMDYFNKNMKTPYVFVINRFSKNVKNTSEQMDCSDIEKKIKNNENMVLLSSENIHQTDKNLISGINEYVNPNIYTSLKNITSEDVSNWEEIFNFKKHRDFFNEFVSKWRENKKEFEEEYLIYLHYLSDLKEENKHSGISLLNSYVLSMLQSQYVGKEFVKAFKSRNWTEKEFLCMNDSMMNPIGLISSFTTANYVDFSEAFINHAKRLNLNAKILSKNQESDKKEDRSLKIKVDFDRICKTILYSLVGVHQQNHAMLSKFPTNSEEIYYFNEKIDYQANFEYLINEPFLKSLSNVNLIIKEAKTYGIINKEKKERKQNINDVIDILLDQRKYEYIIFEVKMKSINYTKIMKAFDTLSIILSDKTNAKITLQMHSKIDMRVFNFKIDERCFKNKDDISVYLKDLLIEMFSLDVKIAHNQIKDYEKNVPVINKLLDYIDNNLNKNNENNVRKKTI